MRRRNRENTCALKVPLLRAGLHLSRLPSAQWAIQLPTLWNGKSAIATAWFARNGPVLTLHSNPKRSMAEASSSQAGPPAGGETKHNGTTESTKSNAADGDTFSKETRANGNTKTSPAGKADGTAAPTHASPKKRRKVNHACVYCRRSHMTCDSERPCTRCIKRNIGHLCHDEPREPSKRARSEHELSAADEEGSSKNEFSSSQGMPSNLDVQDATAQPLLPDMQPHGLPPSTVNPSQSIQPGNISNSSVLGYNDWPVQRQSQFQDMHTFHPSYMFNAPEFTNEYNLLSDFLSHSLLDDGAMYQGDDLQGLYSDPSLLNSMSLAGNNSGFLQPPQLGAAQSQNAGNGIQRPSSTVGNDKARETYYMTAADPSGTDPPEERMNKLLKAKYDAGMLKPFNYVKGYARLNQYMEQHMQPASRQKILRQLDKFRPKFRERMQSLTDIELVLVEMWFERSLMEYDRVFASMAIPACCWRRTGEIFRGNKEMAQLIDVPIENLRDGKLAIHEIIVEDQLVSYWEKFGAIAFDNTQKAMLTSCTLKNPDATNPSQGIPCCFSFTIRRDTHNIPSLIVADEKLKWTCTEVRGIFTPRLNNASHHCYPVRNHSRFKTDT
ncbi:transcriptional regulator family: Fungal Specific TF [Paecilomyces variotii]|nr:transcriptional regulator family: Fungal Specific TF [Paecilomyces variotii]KAJ9290256.1 transcriptional regulator family: Fungal Specific TF [Paecilomyces variotii]KAJ9374165.1 transcriptional regulator family: Fungal Specific TF [Paecilomyces variotii]